MKKQELSNVQKIINYAKGSSTASIQNQLAQTLEENSPFNILLDITNLFFTFWTILQYIISTYDPEYWHNIGWILTDFIIHIYFLLEYLLRIYGAKNVVLYIFSSESIVDIISIFPFFAIRMTIGLQGISGIMGLLDLLRILRFQRINSYIESEINKQLLEILIQVIALVIISASLIQYLQRLSPPVDEKTQELYDLPFHYCIYFVMTTISTVGYQNNFQSPPSRVLVIVLLFFAIIFVPAQSGKLVQLLSSKSYYSRRSYKSVESIKHIVLTGFVSNSNAEDFFQELFHEDHGNQQKDAVMLIPAIPDPQMDRIIQNQNIIYLEGDPLNDKDLKRCQIEKAKSVIILCNKQSANPHQEDARTILIAMVIQKYLKSLGISKTRFCMQILRQEGKTHYYLSLNKQTRVDQVICIEELKMSLLAKSCLCPGLISVVSNLIKSSNIPDNTDKDSDINQEWLHDYWDGQQFEIYKTNLSKNFGGQTFSNAALIIYKNFQAIMFGVELIIGKTSKIFLNPKNMKLPVNVKTVGYIIASDKSVADDIQNFRKGNFGPSSQTMQTENNDNQTKEGFQITSMQTLNPQITMQRSILNAKTLKMQTINDNDQNQQLETPNMQNEIEKHEEAGEDEEEEEEEGEVDVEEEDLQKSLKQENLKNILSGDLHGIAENCYITKDKILLKEVTFKTLENNILANKHIILAGLVDNLINFMMPLRAKYLHKYPTVVILNQIEPSDKVWNQISFFPEIYFVKGSALSAQDLKRANIKEASKIVILTPSLTDISHSKKKSTNNTNEEQQPEQQNNYQHTKDQEDLLDARTIFKYKTIRRLRPDIQIVTELINPQNFAFLLTNNSDYNLMKKLGYSHTPLFASGEIYISSIMDTLCCQAFYNSAIITVLNLLLLGTKNQNGSPQKNKKVKKTQENPFGHDYSNTENSNLFHINVPNAFIGHKFTNLFGYLCQRKNIIVLGLYRKTRCKDNKLPYIYTNPKPDTLLTEKDLLLILSPDTPTEDMINWAGPLEKIDNSNILRKHSNDQNNHSIFQKNKIDQGDEHGETTTNAQSEDLIYNIESNIEKETFKVRQNQKDQELLQERITDIVDQVKVMKQDISDLHSQIHNREDFILDSVKQIFSEELRSFLKQKQVKGSESGTINNTPKNNIQYFQSQKSQEEEYYSQSDEDENFIEKI